MSNPNKYVKFHKEAFQEDLLTWFKKEQRTMPWRTEKSPYRTWISEIMLQQTKVDTIIPYFNRFMEQFPTIESLATAREDEVLKVWEGLGYYSRARNLHATAQEVCEKYDGHLPSTRKELVSLKGIGPYTAGAILSIAFDLPEHAVDGNVMRVLSRVLSIRDDITKAASRKVFEEAVTALISYENPSYFNQGLMELGALICTPRSPACMMCPVQTHCVAFHEGSAEELPVRTKKKRPRPVELLVIVLKDEQGRYLIQRRESEGLLANLWEFPTVAPHLSFIGEKGQLERSILQTYGVKVDELAYVGAVEHVFTHIIWKINVYEGKFHGQLAESLDVQLITEKELDEFALPTAHHKIFEKYLSK